MDNILTCLINRMPGGVPPPPNNTPIINLRASMDRRQAMAEGRIPFVLAEFEELSERIWDTRVEFANQIRRWADPRDRAILAILYAELIGAMPDEEGVVP